MNIDLGVLFSFEGDGNFFRRVTFRVSGKIGRAAKIVRINFPAGWRLNFDEESSGGQIVNFINPVLVRLKIVNFTRPM